MDGAYASNKAVGNNSEQYTAIFVQEHEALVQHHWCCFDVTQFLQ